MVRKNVDRNWANIFIDPFLVAYDGFLIRGFFIYIFFTSDVAMNIILWRFGRWKTVSDLSSNIFQKWSAHKISIYKRSYEYCQWSNCAELRAGTPKKKVYTYKSYEYPDDQILQSCVIRQRIGAHITSMAGSKTFPWISSLVAFVVGHNSVSLIGPFSRHYRRATSGAHHSLNEGSVDAVWRNIVPCLFIYNLDCYRIKQIELQKNTNSVTDSFLLLHAETWKNDLNLHKFDYLRCVPSMVMRTHCNIAIRYKQ